MRSLNDVAPLTELLRYASVTATITGLFVSTWAAAADETGLPYRYMMRYTSGLERKLRPMFIFTPGRLIVMGQAAASFVLIAAAVLIEVPFWWAFLILILIAPSVWIEVQRRKRVEMIEEQLDNVMLALANALKSTPSIGAAFNSVASVVMDPMRQEIDLAIKEMKVGSSLDQALLHMASRVSSRQLDSALSSILIGRQVGGNLPKVLETTASTLREMRRLEGVVRTKTAEGKMQIWVIALMPFGLLVGMQQLWPGYFAPLTMSIVGYMIILFSGGCWVSALVLARKILAVDI